MAEQRDIPIQTDPPETAVTAALRAVAGIAGWCVTHTTDGQHAATSLHYVGRAVDLADRSGPGWDSPQLLDINKHVLQVVPLGMISELIYAGPGGVCVKNGKFVNGLAVFGADVMAGHHNHVHLAVTPDFTYNGKVQITMPDNDPNLPDITGPVSLSVLSNSNGDCTGYFIFSHATGELHAFGPGAKFQGRSEVVRLVQV